ncbi:hypothetical protein BURMUCGD1_4547 [Burkholderia multivorans CGD1]|nr:hypothetical protein BURMUCGD1_4547 [Burkholderia multivorans CGD1]
MRSSDLFPRAIGGRTTVGAVVSARAFCRQIRRPRLTSFHPNLE